MGSFFDKLGPARPIVTDPVGGNAPAAGKADPGPGLPPQGPADGFDPWPGRAPDPAENAGEPPFDDRPRPERPGESAAGRLRNLAAENAAQPSVDDGPHAGRPGQSATQRPRDPAENAGEPPFDDRPRRA